MTEHDFAARFLGEHTVKGNEIIPKLCPFCQGGNHHDKNTFALNFENHTFNCKRGSCNRSGHFNQLCHEYGVQSSEAAPYAPVVRRQYRKPQTAAKPTGSTSMAYLAKRGITPVTAAAFGVGEDDAGNLVFPYYRTPEDCEDKVSTFNKFRKPQKLDKGERKMWREAGTEPILYGMHLCDPAKPLLYLFEGEFDCMCGRQATGENCVSVPSGCEDFTWLETCADFLHQFPIIAVMADNDEPGQKMLHALSMKLDGEVRRPDFTKYRGAKDANEILARHGAEQLVAAMVSITPVPVQGLLNLGDVQHTDPDEGPRITTGIPALDRLTGGLKFGELHIWTGKRGEGKSTILTQIGLEAIEQGHSVCFYSGEIMADRFKYTVNLQAAGMDFVREREDRLTGRTIHYVPREQLDKIERWYNGRFWLYDNTAVEADEAETIFKIFELAYKRYDCRVFTVDNLMVVSTCRSDRDYYQMQADFTIKLSKLAKRLGVQIHLVVHPRKGDIQGNDSIGGLSTITNIADNTFSMRRVPEDEQPALGCDSTVTVMKNRLYGDMSAVKLDFSQESRRFVEAGHAERQYSWAKNEFVEIPDSPDMPF